MVSVRAEKEVTIHKEPTQVLNWARDLLFEYEPYKSMSPQEIGQRVDMPLWIGHLELWDMDGDEDGRILFTWAKPSLPKTLQKLMVGMPLDLEEWQEEGPHVWIVDMAASPWVSGVKVGRFLSYALADLEIAEIGEMVYYRRNGGVLPGRFGKAIVRG